MPLVVSSLTGDASDMFNWTRSVSPGDAQDLSELLQMLREHYCGSFTFQEQRNMVENLCQGAREDATDFMIRVGSSVSNLAKDWKGQITEAELRSLQYEVSLNGVREEIQHVLDSVIARHGQLTPHQMYEAVKKYETYVARNKHLEGKSASPHSGQQRAAAQTSGYRPRFHKTTAFMASVEETSDPALSEPGPSLPEDEDRLGGESTQEGDEGLFIPSFLESKQYPAFTLGSMGLYECEGMPFGLCNTPPTFQRLMQNCLGELNLTYCLIYLDDVIVFSETPEEQLQRMRVVFNHLREHGLKLKPSKCDVFKSEINYLAHPVSRKGVLPSKKNLESIAQCPPPDTYTKVKSFVGLVGHSRCFIKGFAKIAAPLYNLTSGDNKDKKSEHINLSPETLEAFDHLKAACLQAPILAFLDFNKAFLLETDASGRGLGAVLSQKQADGRYHPIAYASHVMNETEQRYHSNKQEFLALKWVVTEQFHEYLSPYGKNRNEFVVRTDNNPLTYIFSSANLDAAGQ